MDKQQTLTQINEIFKDVMDNPDIVLNENTTANDVEEWDSLNHIQVVVAIEKHFKVKFTTQEIQNWKKVGDVIESLNSRLK